MQTDRQKVRQIGLQTDREVDGEIGSQKGLQTDRMAEKQTKDIDEARLRYRRAGL